MEFQSVSEINAKSLGFNGDDPMAQRLADDVRDKILDRRSCMADPGELGLPELLESRRIEHSIPDGAFKCAAAFDRIILWPIELYQEEKIGRIHVPSNVADKDKDTAPEGIIVAAGLEALKVLRSNGMDVGHHVYFLHMNPYWFQCQTSPRGKAHFVRILVVGDIVGSMDLAKDLRTGASRLQEFDDGTPYYIRLGQEPVTPVLPVLPKEY